MKVLVTGAFGNVGQNALKELLKKGFDVRCFDLKTPRNAKIELSFRRKSKLRKFRKWGKFETIWGDIRDKDLVNNLVDGVDCIIHLAAIIPPLAYAKPELAYSVNVDGTTNLVEAAEKMEKLPRFVYASSIAVHGNRMMHEPPTRIEDPLEPLDYDNYAQHKVIMEKRLGKSTLPWMILRFAAITPFDMGWNIPDIMFDVPLEQRIELADTRDVGLACANAVEAKAIGKTFFIGGGKDNQFLQREFVGKMLETMGIGMLPEQAFKPINSIDDYYHCDWMDTEEAQKALQFQNHSFDDFLNEFRRRRWFMKMIATIFRPIARAVLLKKSPYYTKPVKRRRRRRDEKIPTGN